MINFIIPGFYEHTDLNLTLIKLLKTHSDLFYDNIQIGACYGNFQFCIWDGGRIFDNIKQATQENINNICHKFNQYNIPIRFVFTNNQLKEEDCYDRFCNLVLSECDNHFNEIVINNSILEKYIIKNYPNYSLISSTTKCITDTNKLKEELNSSKYKMVCLDYNLNHSYKFLESLTEQEKKKCEFLINPICGVACPNRAEHYRLNSLFSKTYGRIYQMEQCKITSNANDPRSFQKNNHITSEEIQNYYSKQGFSNFKIEGRTWSDYDLATTYARYFSPPKYSLYVLNLLMDMTFNK